MTDEDVIRYEVRVIDAFKSYGRNNVLNGLNMKVPSCNIYGLLGPSGCGKSTLLQCILGTVSLDFGCIDISATSLRDVGYMPQNLCLEELMTIKETFEYYGTLYNMSKKSIVNRIDELNTFLQLPSLNSYINEISGGQSRRVSLAISLLHSPKIIILDEPTVGVDPLVRQNIWTEFRKMVNQHKTTIIITTHYIEEANQADCIGLMRNGVLVEEGSPHDILNKYGTNTLEESFLILCCNQNDNKIVKKNVHVQVEPRLKKTTKIESNIKSHRIKALLKKNYHVCSRDYWLLFAIIFLPILQTLNFCFGIGRDFKYMPIAVRNDEINVLDCQYANVNGCIFDGSDKQKMSCVVLNYLASRDYELIEVNDRDAGEMSMNKPNFMAFLYFPKNYTRDLIKFIDYREHYDSESRAYVHLTKENFLFRNQITRDIMASVKHVVGKILNGCSNDSNSVGIPLKFITLYGHDVKSFANGIISLFIAIIAFYYPSVFAASIMMSEKMDGTLGRSMISGVNILELLISMFFFSTVINLFVMMAACFITFVLFSNPIQVTNGLFVYILMVFLLGWIGFFFGILIAVLSPTKLGSVYVITGASLTQFLLTGAIWPLEGQPKILRIISELLPIRLAGNTLNNIALKGWTLEHSSIVIGTSAILVYTMLLVFVLIVLGKFKKDLWVIQK